MKLHLLSLILCLFSSATLAQPKRFAYPTGIPDTAFYRNLRVAGFNEALAAPEEVIAVSLGSRDTNLSGVKNFSRLQYLFLDETFFLSSVNLKKQKIEALFALLYAMKSLQYVSTCDPALLPYISKIKTLKGLRCNTFDNALFGTLKPAFSNLELLVVNDPAAETVNVGGLQYLKQLEIYSMYLTTIDPSICDLLSLQALRMQPGKLESLPRNLSRLKNLAYFSMTGTTFFTGFPYPVFGLTNLKTLELDLRNVKKIPEGFSNFKNLTTLILNEAQRISELPEELAQLPLLDSLSLSDTDNLSDVSALLKFDHSYTLVLNRCNYVKIAKELAPFTLMKKMVVSRSIYRTDLAKLTSLVPENKLLLADF